MTGRLTARQERFVETYLVDLNATQAAIRAGYAPKSAEVTGSQLLRNPKVAAAIDAVKQARSQRTQVTADRVVQQLARIAFGDIRKIFESTEHGVRLRCPDEWPDEIVPLIAGIEVITVSRGEGMVEHVAKIRAADKLKALELLGRHLGMWNDKLTITTDLPDRIREARRRAQERLENRAEDAPSVVNSGVEADCFERSGTAGLLQTRSGGGRVE